MSKFKKVKTWKDILKDPRVERAFVDSDGFFIYLNPAFYNTQATSFGIREDTQREALRIFNRDVRPAKREEVARMYKWAFDEAPEVITALLDEYEAMDSDTKRIAVVARIDQTFKC